MRNILSKDTVRILAILHEAGFEAYVVGGAVRDFVMGKKVHDFDIVTSARHEQVQALFKNENVDTVGESFCVTMVNGIEVASGDFLSTGNYYAVQRFGTCESKQSDAVEVEVNSPTAPNVSASQTFCDFTNLKVADLQAKLGANILLYKALEGGNPVDGNVALNLGDSFYAAEVIGDCESAGRTFVKVGAGVQIVQKDNGILVINNNPAVTEVHFEKYEWYEVNKVGFDNKEPLKDAKPLKTGTWGPSGKGGYYFAGEETGDLSGKLNLKENVYYIAVLNDNITTCPFQAVVLPGGSIKVYPNPLVSSQVVYVDADMDEAELATANIEIYSPLGSYIGKVKAQRVTPVRLPEEKGVYVLKFKSVETEEYFKIIVK